MARLARVQIQAALATGQLTLDRWDVRRTEDGRVSVVDVIADVRAVGHDYAAQLYRRLLSEERVPQCEVRPPRAHSMASAENTLQRIGRGGARAAQETPAATAPLTQPRGFGAGDPFTEPPGVRRLLPAPLTSW